MDPMHLSSITRPKSILVATDFERPRFPASRGH